MALSRDALDAVIAQSEREARSFWKIREGEPLDRLPYLINFDVSAPTAQFAITRSFGARASTASSILSSKRQTSASTSDRS